MHKISLTRYLVDELMKVETLNLTKEPETFSVRRTNVFGARSGSPVRQEVRGELQATLRMSLLPSLPHSARKT